MKSKIFLFTFWLIIVHFSVGLCGKGEWIELLGDNSTWINWTRYTLYSKSNGNFSELFPDGLDLKRQKINLMNRLYNSILNFEFKDRILFKKILNRKRRNFLWEWINISSNSYLIKTSTNSYRLTMELKLLGALMRQILPISFILTEPDVTLSDLKNEDYVKGYTGVVIEVSTEEFKPSLFIYLYSQNGELLFSPKLMDYNILINKGISLYLTQLDDKIKERVGVNPLFLRANSIHNKNTHSLVLDEHSDFYLKFYKVIELLKKGKLVISKKRHSSFNQDEINEFIIEN